MWKSIFSGIKSSIKWVLYKQRIESKIDIMMRRLVRLEILDAMRRKDTITVYNLFDEYTALGGNSYISDLVELYKQKQKRKKK